MASVTDGKNRDLPVDRPESGRWASRPWLARSVRVAVVLLPFVTATMVAITLSARLPVPANIGWAVLRIALVAIVAAIVYRGAEKYVRRALPLASLLDLSLRFPDRAPSRLAMAMRVASTDDLSFLLDRYRQVGASEPARAAEHLLELVAALSKHDRVTRGHSERVRAYTQMIGQQLGLSGVELDRLRWAGLIHDIGKLRIDADILNKPGRLTDEEFEIIKTHPALGAELAAPLAGWLGDSVLAVAQHHERWDGRGYPLGLSGTEISYAARIVSVADTFDVITSIRSYRQAASTKDAAAELARCAGTQFDPAIVRAFLALPLISIRRVMGPLSWLVSFLSGPSTWLPSWGGVGSSVGSGVSSSAAAAAGSSSAVVGVGAVTGAAAVSSVAAGATVVGAGAAMSSGVGMVISLSLVSGVIATGIGTVAAMQPAPDAAVVPSAPPAAEVTLETVPPSLGDEPIVVTTQPPPAAEQMGPIPPVTTVPIVAVEVPPVVEVPVTSAAPRLSAEVPQTTPTTTAPPTTAPPVTVPPTTAPPTTVVPAPTTTVAPPPPAQAAPIPAAPTERSFTVAVSSPGAGTVLSAPEGIECASTCTGSFLSGSTVSLTAVPATGWNFIGWTSSCQSAGSSTCTVTMSQSRSTTALFARATFDLTVNKQGSGTVSSSDGSLTCGAGCSSSVAPMTNGSTVTLTATPADGWAIDSWSSSCADVGAASTCTLSMSQARSTTVWFTRASYDVTVVSNGQGIVTSDLGGLECGAQCSATVPSGQSVVLTAVPDEGWKFAGWTSSCVAAGTAPTCSLVADADRSTSAFFVPAAFAFTALTNGAGSVTAEVDGEACDATCLAGVDNGATVVLTATPADGWAFVGWTSSCLSAESSPTCTVVADGERSTTAMFAKSAFDLTVNRQGMGEVSSSIGGLSCGEGCPGSTVTVPNGAGVTVTATPADGWVVGHWSNSACSDGATSCTFTMTQDWSTTVWFKSNSFVFTANASGPGSVSAMADGVPCDTACLAAVPRGATVVLTAVPGDKSGFIGWSSSCKEADSDPTCTLVASSDRSTTATFARTAFALNPSVGKPSSGSIVASLDGAPCDAACLSGVPAGASVTFTPAAATNWEFSSWGGLCAGAGSAPECVVSAAADGTVTAVFVRQTVKVTANVSGAGSGSVSAMVDGEPCDVACLGAVPRGATVVLTAVPGDKFGFTGWSSSCQEAGTALTCSRTANSDLSTTASFKRTAYAYAVQIRETQITATLKASGSVTASIDGKACDAVCLSAVPAGKSVTFTAVPDDNSLFGGWSGPCSVAPAKPAECVVAPPSIDPTVAATFVRKTVSVTANASGRGSVSATVNGAPCDTECLKSVPVGSTVELKAVPGDKAGLSGWSSSCASEGSAPTCLRVANNNLSTTATFVRTAYELTLTQPSAAAGSISARVGGSACDASCLASVPAGTEVTFTPHPAKNWGLSSWGGLCPGAGSVSGCVLKAAADGAVTGSFVRTGYAFTVSIESTKNSSTLIAAGSVTASVDGKPCDSSCLGTVPAGRAVTFTAAPDPNSMLGGWSSNCAPVQSVPEQCVVAPPSSDTTVTASFRLKTVAINVSSSNIGTVSATVDGVACDAVCLQAVPRGATVVLTATPKDKQLTGFSSWNNGCQVAGTNAVCTLVATGDVWTTASFTRIAYKYNLGVSGSGSIEAKIGGTECDASCLAVVPAGAKVTFTAFPAANWAHSWGGLCAGTNRSCEVTAAADGTVTASFVRQTVKVTVTANASGPGSVLVTVDGAPCDVACLGAVPRGATISLTAMPSVNGAFTSWSSSCAQPAGETPNPVCTRVADRDMSLSTTAFFVSTAYVVRVNKNKTGSGTVTMSSGGVSCGLGCDTTGDVTIPVGQPVTITATPAPGWKVTWGKACPNPATASTTTCTVTGNWAVTVTFAPV